MKPEPASTEASEVEGANHRRERSLHRDTDDRMIAGVCSGLGHYFDVHTTLVRVAFVVFTLLGGAGVLAYVVLWFAIDSSSDTPAEQAEITHTSTTEQKADPS